jgi:PAS domain S-box-containing protein
LVARVLWEHEVAGSSPAAPTMAKGERLPPEDVEHYRILSEMASDYAFRTRIGEDGVPMIEWMSESWARDFGYRPDGEAGIFEHIHPHDHPHVVERWSELQAGRSIEGEIRVLPRSGGELWVHYRAKPILDPDTGKLIGTYGSMQDIHERKSAEELWRRAETRFRAQFQSSPIATGIWQRVGDEFILIDFNRAADQLTNGGIARLLGRTAHEFFPEGSAAIEDIGRCFETGETVRREMAGYRFRSTGEVRDLSVTWARVPPNMVMVHIIDVTEWRRAEAERRELQARLEAARGN